MTVVSSRLLPAPPSGSKRGAGMCKPNAVPASRVSPTVHLYCCFLGLVPEKWDIEKKHQDPASRLIVSVHLKPCRFRILAASLFRPSWQSKRARRSAAARAISSPSGPVPAFEADPNASRKWNSTSRIARWYIVFTVGQTRRRNKTKSKQKTSMCSPPRLFANFSSFVTLMFHDKSTT